MIRFLLIITSFFLIRQMHPVKSAQQAVYIENTGKHRIRTFHKREIPRQPA
jgi:hypothetical protein